MPYIYSVYEIEWNQERTEYKRHLLHEGTSEQLVEAGKYKNEKVLKQAFGTNLRSRMNKNNTKRVFEREWKPEPGEVKPVCSLPDKYDGVYPPSKNRGNPGAKYGRRAGKDEGYKPVTYQHTPLEADVHRMLEDNKRRMILGKKPLSYGQWRAGIG